MSFSIYQLPLSRGYPSPLHPMHQDGPGAWGLSISWGCMPTSGKQ